MVLATYSILLTQKSCTITFFNIYIIISNIIISIILYNIILLINYKLIFYLNT